MSGIKATAFTATVSHNRLIAYLNSTYGDGYGSWTAVFTVCPALAVVGKLAVATGAWPAAARRALYSRAERQVN